MFGTVDGHSMIFLNGWPIFFQIGPCVVLEERPTRGLKDSSALASVEFLKLIQIPGGPSSLLWRKNGATGMKGDDVIVEGAH